MADEKKKKSHRKRLEKITRGRYLSRHRQRLGGTYVLFTTRLNRCQSIHRLHVFPARGGRKAASADRYRADIRTISRRSSRGNLHRRNGKKVQRTSSSGRITIDWRVLDMCALSTETVSSFRRQMFLLRNAIIQ